MTLEPKQTEFIYLHGFASSPGSRKAQAFEKKFKALGLPLAVLDLERGDFENLTITSQIGVIENYLNERREIRFGVIGSSMGGYLGAVIAEKRPEIEAAYLMAPGFNFLTRWRRNFQLDTGGGVDVPDLIQVFHYGYNTNKLLNTFIFKDAEIWDKIKFERNMPIRVVHGIHDDTVPVEESREFAKSRPWCKLKELDADHSLVDPIEWIVDDCIGFFREAKLI